MIRDFVDATGSSWQVWEVDPQQVHQRCGTPAERATADATNVESVRWNNRYASAWLCFDNPRERRRLMPVPANWCSLSETKLAELCDGADSVKRLAQPSAESARPSPPAYTGTERRRASDRRVVLIVEDNFDNRLIYSAYFQHAGYRVVEADDAANCVDIARRQQPDLIVMGQGLRTVDSAGATEALKAEPSTAHIRILLLTAPVRRGNDELALSSPADGYLSMRPNPRAVLIESERVLSGSVAG